MIINFKCAETQTIFTDKHSKLFPQSVVNVGKRKLDMLHAAHNLQDLRVPPGNRLEALKGDLAGLYSIRINDQYRIIFRYNNGNAYDVYIKDYH